MLLAARINECEHACTLIDATSHSTKVRFDDMMKALRGLSESWGHIKLSMKAKIAEIFLVNEMEQFGEKGDLDGITCSSIVSSILPFSPGVDSYFDGNAPTIHAALAELQFLISAHFEEHELDCDDPNEEMKDLKGAAQARF